jgi:lactate dehydrogenase-like 2-hydroxyacid dehydrogenase
VRTRGAPFSCRAFPPEKEEEKKKKNEKATFLVFEEDKKDDDDDDDGREDARALFIIDVMIKTDTDAMIARFFFSPVCVCVFFVFERKKTREKKS